MKFRLSAVVLSLAAVVACSSSPPGEQPGFYTWVDAQGNLVTVERGDTPPAGKADGAVPPTSSGASAIPRAEAPSVTPTDNIVTADNPVALWEAGDDAYVTEQEVQARLEARDRERFVTYPEEDGRLVTRSLDMKAVKDASASRGPGYETLAQAPGPEYAAGSIALRADCCARALEKAIELKVGEESRLVFTGRTVSAIEVDGLRPALVFRLESGVTRLEVQSWLRDQGYLHPQLLFLDQAGSPLLLIDYPFSRRYPETFFAWASLFGEVPRPADARWVVVYLPYASVEDGRAFLSGERLPASEAGMSPRIRGDAVIRAK